MSALELPQDLLDSGLVNLNLTFFDARPVAVGFRANVDGVPVEESFSVDGDAQAVLDDAVTPRIRELLGIYLPEPEPEIELAPEAAQDGAASPAAEAAPDAKAKRRKR